MDRADAGGVVVVEAPDGALRQVAEAGARDVLLGVDLAEPLTLARALHAAHPGLNIALHVRPEEHERLSAVLAGNPLALGPLSCTTRSGPGAPARAAAPERHGGADAWSVLDLAPEPAMLVGGDGRVLGLNPAARLLFGQTERGLLGVWFPGLFAESVRARVAAHVRDGGRAIFACAHGTDVALVAWRFPGEDTTVRVVLLRTPDDAERQIGTERQFLDAIVEHIPTMVFVKEARDLRFVRFNRAGEALLGYPRADLLGRNDYDFFPKAEADFFTHKDREVLAAGAVVDIPAEPIHTSTGLRWLHTRKVPLLDAAGRPHHLLGISEDITERRAAEEERARLIAELERSNGELQLFASIASHDLQEPLRKVQQFGGRLRAQLGADLSPESLDTLTRMEAAIGRMRELVYGLLTYSRVTSRGQELVGVALGGVMEEVIADLEVPLARAKGEVQVGALPAVWGDPPQLRQLFQNLIGNAIKFHAPGVAPRVEVRAHELPGEPGEPPMVEIAVRDNGIGFDPADAEVVFQPFQRLHGRDRFEGTGLGLAICRRIVERHLGSIGVETAPGQGAIFRVRLRRKV